MKQTKNNGFTLVELMIVVAIVGILSAIAYPSYQNSVLKSRRADAKSALLQLTNFMERLYTETGCYNPGADRQCNTGDDGDPPALPFTTSPPQGIVYYDLSIVAVDASSFTLSAVPVAGSPQDADTQCGTLMVDNFGNKSAVSPDCW